MIENENLHNISDRVIEKVIEIQMSCIQATIARSILSLTFLGDGLGDKHLNQTRSELKIAQKDSLSGNKLS